MRILSCEKRHSSATWYSVRGVRFRAASAGIVLALSGSLAASLAASPARAQSPAPTDSAPAQPPPTSTPTSTSSPAEPPSSYNGAASGPKPRAPAEPIATIAPPATTVPPAPDPKAGAVPGEPPKPAPAEPELLEKLKSGFSFGSYGRMIAATDFRGRPGKDADLVAHGSRLDEANYVELELRRDDSWAKTDSRTRVVATLALSNPVFHYNGEFDVKLAVRNLFIEERDLGIKRLSAWAGSRMYRGDDLYLLDFWPLDNLNTVGGGLRYEFTESGRTWAALHVGLNRPNGAFYYQSSQRPLPNNQIGAATVDILNRQQTIASLKLSHIVPLSGKAGLKGVLYAEVHGLSSGQRESDTGVFESVPGENGAVFGAQLGGFTGERDSHLNLFVRYATGIAAYGEFAQPSQLSLAHTTEGAHEILLAAGGNWERGPFGLMAAAYLRSFRNASQSLDNDDVDEGIIALRPHLFFGEWGGVSVEGSFQAQQRGVLFAPEPVQGETKAAPQGPLSGTLWRFGIVPFFSPAGRGDYSRPHFRLIYVASVRDKGAQAFYPKDDVFGLRAVEHFFGFGAEWWFNSSSYGG
jgi:maltoporin